MSTIKNNQSKPPVDEFVGLDGGIISGDRNVTNDSEIETGPVQKPFNDDSDYEKGMSTTTDRAARYRQNIPWFAVYSYRGSAGRGMPVNENKRKTLTKKEIEHKIKEDLVKKSKRDGDMYDKDFDGKTEKIVDTICDMDLSDNQLEKIKKAVLDKIMSKNG